ncbi:DUF4124 domain-containing protein [Marinobacter sp. JSM 1782161]|uniref:DUF4124 domain-containing protein n=1 Tax=Marinobacter sp. JSM 1782161 TaxID=2685906 RepID=UPI001403415D|nr:DUF4124 domain-containing protein [Marinobacter sp. JSM 1782161]
MMYKIMAAALIAVASPALQAEVYQWTDDQGRVHFGDRPPEQGNARTMELRQPQKLNGEGENNTQRLDDLDDFFQQRREQRQAEEAAAAEEAARDAERAEACRRMLAELRHMESVRVFYELNDQGERVYLDDAAGDRYRREFRQNYEKHCN